MKYMYDVSVHLLHLSSQLLNTYVATSSQTSPTVATPPLLQVPSFDEFTVQNSTYT